MVERIFVTSNSMATISCPECGKTMRKNVSKFMNHKAQIRLKCKCSCQHSFPVILERRLSIRKDVNLWGHIIQGSKKNTITIKDISRNGVRIKILQEIILEEGQEIVIYFTLDDPNRSEVSKRVNVIKIHSPTIISCEFLNKNHQGNLGKYFLFYFSNS